MYVCITSAVCTICITRFIQYTLLQKEIVSRLNTDYSNRFEILPKKKRKDSEKVFYTGSYNIIQAYFFKIFALFI